MRKALSLAFVTLLVGVGLCPGLVEAAMIKPSLEQLSQGVESIVLGTVSNQVSTWNVTHTAIYTDVTVEVEEAMKGTVGPEVTFRIAGGEVGHIGMWTSTDPTFRIGERVIVFLHREGSTAQLFGLQHGKFTVSDGTVTQDGQVMPVPDFRSAIQAAPQ
jgi:hypothetical protein